VKKLLSNMWVYALILLVLSMGLSTLFFLVYMKDHV
jgi:hypothetical protein